MSMYKAPSDVRLLIVEDDIDTAEMMLETLHDHFGPTCATHVATLAEARERDPYDVDMVLSDMNLPDGSGLELLEDLLLERPDLPVVFITGEGIMENAVKAIREGAYDYVVKAGDYMFTIPIIVEKNLAMHCLKQENVLLQQQLTASLGQAKTQNAELEHIAATDPLTGIANRRAITDSIGQRFAEAQRRDGDLAILMMDFDGFKQLNDTLGHQQGDHLLVQAAKVFQANSRTGDVPGRLGGDEYILLLPDTEEEEAAQMATRIREEFNLMTQNEFTKKGYAGRLTLSQGLATLKPQRPATAEVLIDHADQALYAAKGAGKNCLYLYRGEACVASALV